MKSRVFNILLLLSCAFFLTGCNVDDRRDVPPEASATIDRVTDDIAAGRADRVYAEAAEEWRGRVSAEENQKMLERVRERLGRVASRALDTGREQQQGAGGEPSGHLLRLTYQTTFERGTGMEQFTLLERDGRWLLAGYSVNSNALEQ